MATTSADPPPSEGYPLLCLENPLLDIQAQGDAALLAKYGLKANDAILAEAKHHGLFDDLLQNHSAVVIAGGAAQNTARGAQYMLAARSVLYIGCVGADASADTLRAAAAQAGLRVEYRVDDSGQATGRCGVIITGHERSMCTDLAAANHYQLEHLQRPPIWRLVERARIYYVGGYHLTVCLPAVVALAEEAASEGKQKVLVLSLAAPFIPLLFKTQLDQTAPYWDYVVGNETEARSWAEAHDLKTTDIATIAKHLAVLPKKNTTRPRTVIVTQGTDPTIVAVSAPGYASSEALSASNAAKHSHSSDIAHVTLLTYPVPRIAPDQINDTNGAGDAFAGGFLAGLVQGVSLDAAVDMGMWLAGLSIREQGPSYPFPKRTYQPLSSSLSSSPSASSAI
ncbi:MAG: adenosine kinase [Phylliscum demangeonii]|nr:MAG: adenosine kinase [Phylliscum demangeonii]